jgi:hypothetical protein
MVPFCSLFVKRLFGRADLQPIKTERTPAQGGDKCLRKLLAGFPGLLGLPELLSTSIQALKRTRGGNGDIPLVIRMPFERLLCSETKISPRHGAFTRDYPGVVN